VPTVVILSVHFNIVLPQHWDVGYGLDTCGALVLFPAGTRDWFSSSRKCPDRLCSVNPLKTKRRPLYLKVQPYRAVNTFHLGYKNQSVYGVSGTSLCLFSDKYKTH